MLEKLIDTAIIEFQELTTLEKLNKGQLLHRAGETNSNLYLVTKGILRSFYYKNGKDITAHFASEYSIIGAVDSITKNKQSIYNIEALEDSIIYRINYHELDKFLNKNPRLERIARQISQILYFNLAERIEGLTFLSAKERYERLLLKHPTIIQRVKLGHIASFLGMTIETLSRVRGQS